MEKIDASVMPGGRRETVVLASEDGSSVELRPMAFDYTVTVEDVVSASQLVNRPRRRTEHLVLATIGMILAVAWWFLVGVIAALAAIVLFSALILLTPYRDRWHIARSPAARIGTKCELRIDDDGIHFSGGGMTGTVAWAAITDSVEDQKVMVLRAGKAPLVWIPKRVLTDRQPLDLLRAWIRRKAAPVPPES